MASMAICFSLFCPISWGGAPSVIVYMRSLYSDCVLVCISTFCAACVHLTERWYYYYNFERNMSRVGQNLPGTGFCEKFVRSLFLVEKQFLLHFLGKKSLRPLFFIKQFLLVLIEKSFLYLFTSPISILIFTLMKTHTPMNKRESLELIRFTFLIS